MRVPGPSWSLSDSSSGVACCKLMRYGSEIPAALVRQSGDPGQADGSQMLSSTPRAAVLCGLGSWTPPNIVTNEDLAAVLDTSDEWIRRKTGVVRRHIAIQGMATSELAVEAGQRALKSADLDMVDTLILATTTPDRPCPATAPEVADRLGLGTIAAFDVAAVCSGFIYALANGAGLIAAEIADRVLVIGAEVFSTILNPCDRTTRAIFGDGAGAVVLRAGNVHDMGAIGPFTLGSDGRGSDLITVRAGGSRMPYDADGSRSERYFVMQGQSVYRQAVAKMAQSTSRVLELAEWPISIVDWLVCHQANRRILDSVAARLGIPAGRCLSNIDEVGNTAAASIPLALAHGVECGALRPGDHVALTAFGGGLTWGSTLLRWPEIACGN
jgi:3-oxoacyl-[acyl-carrier-protein] synthase III